jgi:Rrf2 family protein
MRISTKGRYALRLMVDLAVHTEQGGVAPIRSIAERQDLSDKYLEQIISQLSRAGFVKSVRGAQGGYRLSRDPATYTVGDILRLMEGDLAPVACGASKAGDACCGRYDNCATVEVWQKLSDAINSVADSITLADLVKSYHAKCPDTLPSLP